MLLERSWLTWERGGSDEERRVSSIDFDFDNEEREVTATTRGKQEEERKAHLRSSDSEEIFRKSFQNEALKKSDLVRKGKNRSRLPSVLEGQLHELLVGVYCEDKESKVRT